MKTMKRLVMGLSRLKLKYIALCIAILVGFSAFYRYTFSDVSGKTKSAGWHNKENKKTFDQINDELDVANVASDDDNQNNTEYKVDSVAVVETASRSSVLIVLPDFHRQDAVTYGVSLPFCGMQTACPKDHFPAFVYSGKNKDEEPKICVNGRFVIDKNLNKAGRGINIAIVNVADVRVLRVAHFDTYAEDSNSLEVFLEEVASDEMVIAVTFDEASTKLSNMAKQMLYEMGSSYVQNIKFRSSWYFVGQKGITGFTPFEELNYAIGNDWAKAVDVKMCLPSKLDGVKLRPDPALHPRNDAKRHFCQKYDGYEDFCDVNTIDDLHNPAPLSNNYTLEDKSILQVPILVIAGLAHNSLRLCLETIIRQPGINPSYVLVTYDDNYVESGELANLFHFKHRPVVNSTADYNEQLKKSFDIVWDVFPKSEYVIVVEEELTLSPDFVQYMSQMLLIFKNDATILSVSSWNANGFKGTSGSPELAYRVEDFPGMGFMLRRRTYEQYLRPNFEKCCHQRTFEGWSVPKDLSGHTIVPDVSRISRRHADGFGIVEEKVEDLFHRERTFTTSISTKIKELSGLTSRYYDDDLLSLIKKAVVWNDDFISKCYSKGSTNNVDNSLTNYIVHSQYLPGGTTAEHSNLVVPFSQKKTFAKDHSRLKPLCRCFGLYYSRREQCRGVYKGVLRFAVEGRQIFLVGSNSPFYPLIDQGVAPRPR